MKFLVINPNSTASMTHSLREEITNLNLDHTIHYYTGPRTAPASIDNQQDAELSTRTCIEDIKANHAAYLSDYDGYLIACYSDHPLVHELPKFILRSTPVVMGIFQASMLYALQFASEGYKAGILTSGYDWEPLLDCAIVDFIGEKCNDRQNANITSIPNSKFVNTLAAGIPVLDLHKPESYVVLKEKISELVDDNVGIILLGCAGLSTLNGKMKADFPQVRFVDSVKVGIRLLISYAGIGHV